LISILSFKKLLFLFKSIGFLREGEGRGRGGRGWGGFDCDELRVS
jgi:hypothetical protein